MVIQETKYKFLEEENKRLKLKIDEFNKQIIYEIWVILYQNYYFSINFLYNNIRFYI